MNSLQKTIEKIKNLEAEKKNLLAEMEDLKKMADAKATNLEMEIASIRNEIKSLKVIMGQQKPTLKLVRTS